MTKEKIDAILNYCEPHLDQMWAAKIVSVILDCDFRDSKDALEKYKAPKVEKEMDDYDSKDIYLKSPKGEIVGLHAIGVKGPYEFILKHLDGTEELIKTDFQEFEKWGNEYDNEYNILGRGSFRIFDLSIEHAAKCWEDEGWVRFERAK